MTDRDLAAVFEVVDEARPAGEDGPGVRSGSTWGGRAGAPAGFVRSEAVDRLLRELADQR
jgi:hypothetical protein